MNVVVFAPHPDDELIGCGGTIAKLCAAKHSVTVVYLTSGEAGDMSVPPAELAKIREQEALAGLDLLGDVKSVFLHLPDGAVAYTPEALAEITKLVRQLQPNQVYLPHELDAHPDHRASHQLIREALNRAGGNAFADQGSAPWVTETVLAYEVWTPLSSFEYVEDISSTVDAKLEALRCHQSQLKNVAYDEAAEGLSRYRGAMTQVGTLAEVFQVLKLSRLPE